MESYVKTSYGFIANPDLLLVDGTLGDCDPIFALGAIVWDMLATKEAFS